MPDLATSLPQPTNGGRSYTFRLRPGVRYSTGQPVRPEDFRRALERTFELRSAAAYLYAPIRGASVLAQTSALRPLRRGGHRRTGAHRHLPLDRARPRAAIQAVLALRIRGSPTRRPVGRPAATRFRGPDVHDRRLRARAATEVRAEPALPHGRMQRGPRAIRTRSCSSTAPSLRIACEPSREAWPITRLLPSKGHAMAPTAVREPHPRERTARRVVRLPQHPAAPVRQPSCATGRQLRSRPAAFAQTAGGHRAGSRPARSCHGASRAPRRCCPYRRDLAKSPGGSSRTRGHGHHGRGLGNKQHRPLHRLTDRLGAEGARLSRAAQGRRLPGVGARQGAGGGPLVVRRLPGGGELRLLLVSGRRGAAIEPGAVLRPQGRTDDREGTRPRTATCTRRTISGQESTAWSPTEPHTCRCSILGGSSTSPRASVTISSTRKWGRSSTSSGCGRGSPLRVGLGRGWVRLRWRSDPNACSPPGATV